MSLSEYFCGGKSKQVYKIIYIYVFDKCGYLFNEIQKVVKRCCLSFCSKAEVCDKREEKGSEL